MSRAAHSQQLVRGRMLPSGVRDIGNQNELEELLLNSEKLIIQCAWSQPDGAGDAEIARVDGSERLHDAAAEASGASHVQHPASFEELAIGLPDSLKTCHLDISRQPDIASRLGLSVGVASMLESSLSSCWLFFIEGTKVRRIYEQVSNPF